MSTIKANTIENVAGTETHDVATMGIESGSNANGSYTKFPDGTLICTIERDFTTEAISVSNGSTYIRGSYSWSFPHAFISKPSLSGSIERLAVVNTFVSPNSISATSCTYYIGASVIVPADVAKYANFIAIGRWK